MRTQLNRSVGPHGIAIVNVKTTRAIPDRPLFDSRVYGGVTVVKWIKRAGRVGDVILLGTDVGYLMLWGRRSEVSL